MSPPTTRESDKFIVRLPDGMRDRIKAAAEANNRSMNAEIVARLEASFASFPPLPVIDPESITAIMRQVSEAMEGLEERVRSLEASGGKVVPRKGHQDAPPSSPGPGRRARRQATSA